MTSLRGLTWNPIVEKEVRSRMRTQRAQWIITVFLTVLAGIGMLAFAAAASSQRSSGASQLGRQTGLQVFTALSYCLLVLILIIAPAVTAASISGERDRQTLDLLLCTRVRPARIVLGKLIASLLFLLLLVLVAVPVFTMVFLFGGVDPGQIFSVAVIIIVTAVTVGALGMLASSLGRRGAGATVAAYVMVILFLTVPALVGFVVDLATTPQGQYTSGISLLDIPNPLVAVGTSLSTGNAGLSSTVVGVPISGSTQCSGNVCSYTSGNMRCMVVNNRGGNGSSTSCSSFNGGSGFSGGAVSRGSFNPYPGQNLGATHVGLSNDEVVAGPLTGWRVWQILAVANLGFSALVLGIATLVLDRRPFRRKKRAVAA